MTRRSLVDPLLIVSCLALGSYLLVTAHEPGKEQRLARAEHLLPRFSASRLSRLSLKSADTDVQITEDRKQPGEYRLDGDLEGHADVALVRELVSALEFATWKRRLRSDETQLVQQIANEQPRLELGVETDQTSYRLVFFRETGVSSLSGEAEVYAKLTTRKGDEVWGVLAQKLLSTLSRTKQELRGGQLFPFSMESTRQLAISEDGAEKLEIEADELGFVLRENHTRADRTLSDVLFYHLAQAQVTQFIPHERTLALLALDPKRKTVTQRGAGRDVTVVFGGSCPSDAASILAHRSSPPQISGCVPGSVWAGLTLHAADLIDRTATVFASDEIDHVTISGARSSLDLMRKDAGFVLLSRNNAEVPVEAGSEFLDVLSQGKLLPVSAPSQTLPPARIVSLVGTPKHKRLNTEPWQKRDSHAAPEHRLELRVHDTDQGVLVERSDDGAWLSVPNELAWAFSQDDAWARSRQLLQLKPEEVSWARVEHLDPAPGVTPSAETIARDGAGYVFTSRQPKTAGLVPDQTLSRRLFEELAQLHAVKWLTHHAPPEHPTLRVVFRTSQPIEHELLVGHRTRGGFFAWSSLSDTAFILPYEVGLSLSAPLFDRSAAQFEPDEFSSIAIEMDGRLAKLKRVAGRLQSDSPDLPPDLAGALEEALRGLLVLAQLPEQRVQSPISLRIVGHAETGSKPRFDLEISGLTPFQDGLAYVARLSGHPGAFVLSSSSVQALKVLL